MPPALVALVFFAAGIMLDRRFDMDWSCSFLVAAAAVANWFVCNRFVPGKSKKLECFKTVCVLLGCCGAGAYWHHGVWNWFPANELSAYAQDETVPVCLRAKIKGEGKYSAQTAEHIFDARPAQARTTYLVQPIAIRNSRKWEPVSGVAKLVIHADENELLFGDEIEVYGKLAAIRAPTSPGQFNFKNFYRSKGIGVNVHVYQQDSIAVTKSNQKLLAGALTKLRRRLNRAIWNHVGKDQAAFASAIMLGNREQLGREKREQFVATGTAHLLAISGLHIGILASMFLLLYRLGLLNRTVALWATILFVVFYSWLVEFRPPVTRAALLLTLFCSGRLLGRTGFELNLLAVAGIVILVANPSDLFMLGPQLSFLAVASLIMFKQHIFPPLSDDPIDILIRGTRPWWVRMTSAWCKKGKQAVMVSGLIWLISLPLIAANYHMVAPVSLIANPLVMGPIALALFCGLAVCCFGAVFPPLADLFGTGTEKSLQLVQLIIERSEAIEYGHWWTAGPLQISIAIFYFALIGLAFIPSPKRFRWLVVAGMLWVSLLWILPLQIAKTTSDGTTTSCTFIDVGHGSATWIESRNGQNVLFDAGSMSSSRFAAETVSNVLWEKQVEHLDAVIISHADLDHFNAVPELARRFSIGIVYISEPMARSEHPVVAELLKQLDELGVPVEALSNGHIAEIDGAQTMEVLLPPRNGTGGNDNSNSIVLAYRAGERSILLPGDLEGNGMQYLLQMPSLDCDVVAMPHHGSKNSRPDEFVDWCLPEHVVISASGKKTDRNVVAEVGRAVRSIASTGDVGTIQALVSDDGIKMRHWQRNDWVEMPDDRSTDSNSSAAEVKKAAGLQR